MKRLSFILFPLIMSCSSCQIIKDQAVAPSELDQNRILFQIETKNEVGIHGTIATDKPILIRDYGAGTVTLRGMGDCGYITSGAAKEPGWISIDPASLPDKEFCLYSAQLTTNGFDAPAIGHVLVRRFTDPNVKPLKTEVNGEIRDGVNWVQLRADSDQASTQLANLLGNGGIFEDRDVLVYLGWHSGKLNITGCGMRPNVIEYTHMNVYRLTVDYLYKEIGNVVKSCVFTITANHDDAVKESASVFVKTYKGTGSFLDAPMVEVTDSDVCFRFQDPYVAGMAVNGKYSGNSSMCVSKASGYIVEGVTSKSRMFYGEHSGTQWVVLK